MRATGTGPRREGLKGVLRGSGRSTTSRGTTAIQEKRPHDAGDTDSSDRAGRMLDRHGFLSRPSQKAAQNALAWRGNKGAMWSKPRSGGTHRKAAMKIMRGTAPKLDGFSRDYRIDGAAAGSICRFAGRGIDSVAARSATLARPEACLWPSSKRLAAGKNCGLGRNVIQV